MARSFFEAFPGLKVDRSLYDIFEQTTVERLSTNSERSRYKVTMRSDHLIHKKYVISMQNALKRQVFAEPGTEVYICERYALSHQYTPERLMHDYYDSLVVEFASVSHVAEAMFRDAKITYPSDSEIDISIEDSCFARKMSGEIRDFLERVFSERCGIPANINISFHEAAEKTKAVRKEEWVPIAKPAASPDNISAADPGVNGSDNNAGKSEGESVSRPESRPVSEGNAATSYGKSGRGERGRGRFMKGYKRSDNPDVLYGKDIDEKLQLTTMADIVDDNSCIVVHGKVTKIDRRDIRNNKTIVKFCLSDFTDSVYCKIFIGTEYADEFSGGLKEGGFVKVCGISRMDSYDHEVIIDSLQGIMSIPSFEIKRQDNYVSKRVELHCHTKMSDMDGVSECKDLVKQAYAWGMPAIAITDHGNIQAFPDAEHVRMDMLSAENAKRKENGLEPIDAQKFFKVIYGVECYLVDDMKPVAFLGTDSMPDTRIESCKYVVFDIETTGFNSEKDSIIEIGAYKVEVKRQKKDGAADGDPEILTGTILDEFSELIDPKRPIPYRITQLTHISDDMVEGKDTIDKVLPRFLEFCRGAVLVGHNVSFDCGFIKSKCHDAGLPFDYTWVDTVGIARAELPGHANYRLDTVAKELGVVLDQHHRGDQDAYCTAEIFVRLLPMLDKDNVFTFGDLNKLGESNPEVISHLRMNHCILLAKNSTGRTNLYRMISESNLRYFARKPRIPKSLLEKRREGIIVGSACVMGELMQAIIDDRSEEEIAGIVRFYDYLEIQPIANNRFLIDEVNKDGEKRFPAFNTEEDLISLNKRVVKLGEQFGKTVCATCDVHFKDPEDQIYRTILQDRMGMTDEAPAPLFLRTTDEMMQEFSYLGPKKCEEVVITNTQKIANMIEAISPVRPDKCPPVIPHSDETLREICYRRAHELYGDNLPEIVSNRLEKELSSIIKNGYSVMYIIAQKLVWKSNEDGYLVGSRGSVGSSFVATMAGITEVNPLAPHYRCPKCKYSDFDSDIVKDYALKTGIDLPPATCPVCGAPLKGDGFGIPFETFLGFNGDKEPDIDLNFSGEYQAKAHAYTKVIFGHEQTFKAGTIATLADKTAFGYVKGYYEDKGEPKRTCEIERLSQGLIGVRRSTGQHPGGIVVLPVGEEINSFTPVQHPANDMTTDIVTTHFDYHSIDHNLLKLDILGHDDPTMIRMLQDLTGLDPMEIPLNDPDVMSLFQSTEALGIRPDDIGGVTVGTLGIPEFGTKFVMGMLEDTKPTTMTELVKISGLSHGTDVWLGNAQEHIDNGDCTLLTCIGCRDDIMSYLISQGMNPSKSFKTMESVRKGKGLKPDMVEAMQAADVPDWYMDSCRKIKYMFPKGHAAAYVMMALRIAYCKVHYPLAYYCAYFSIRATDFDYGIMAQGQAHLKQVMADYQNRKDQLTPKEQDTYGDMLLVEEFYARGFEFMQLDLQKALSRLFRIIDGKLMPSFKSINGMGEKAADAIEEAVKDGPFTSKDDLRNRSKAPKTVLDAMGEMGLLGGLPESDQISLFDLMK